LRLTFFDPLPPLLSPILNKNVHRDLRRSFPPFTPPRLGVPLPRCGHFLLPLVDSSAECQLSPPPVSPAVGKHTKIRFLRSPPKIFFLSLLIYLQSFNSKFPVETLSPGPFFFVRSPKTIPSFPLFRKRSPAPFSDTISVLFFRPPLFR